MVTEFGVAGGGGGPTTLSGHFPNHLLNPRMSTWSSISSNSLDAHSYSDWKSVQEDYVDPEQVVGDAGTGGGGGGGTVVRSGKALTPTMTPGHSRSPSTGSTGPGAAPRKASGQQTPYAPPNQSPSRQATLIAPTTTTTNGSGTSAKVISSPIPSVGRMTNGVGSTPPRIDSPVSQNQSQRPRSPSMPSPSPPPPPSTRSVATPPPPPGTGTRPKSTSSPPTQTALSPLNPASQSGSGSQGGRAGRLPRPAEGAHTFSLFAPLAGGGGASASGGAGAGTSASGSGGVGVGRVGSYKNASGSGSGVGQQQQRMSGGANGSVPKSQMQMQTPTKSQQQPQQRTSPPQPSSSSSSSSPPAVGGKPSPSTSGHPVVGHVPLVGPPPIPVQKSGGFPPGIVMDALVEEDEEAPFTPRMGVLDLNRDSVHSGGGKTLRHRGAIAVGPPASSSSGSPKNHSSSPHARTTPPGASTSTLPSTLSLSAASTESVDTLRGRPVHTVSGDLGSGLTVNHYEYGERPSKGTKGYTNLVLPRAPPPTVPQQSTGVWGRLFGRGGGEGGGGGGGGSSVDLTKSGLAQITMASVEVVRGLASSSSGVLFSRRRGRKESLTSGSGNVSDGGGGGDLVVGFTAYRKPPDSVPSNCLLVQVWAVGLDQTDGRLVGIPFGSRTSGAGAVGPRRLGVGTTFSEEPMGMTEDEEVGGYSSSASLQGLKRGLAGLGRTLSLKARREKRRERKASLVANGGGGGGESESEFEGRLGVISGPKAKMKAAKRRSGTPSSISTPPPLSASASTHAPSFTLADPPREKEKEAKMHVPSLGYIPGRSFVGRVIECGSEVKEELYKKGDWVVGLLDVRNRRGGGLVEFLVVDRHRVWRVGQPWSGQSQSHTQAGLSPLTLEEMALLAGCGVPAYRAVRTLLVSLAASPSTRPNLPPAMEEWDADYESYDERPRALVLRGHDGIGSMVVQMLVRKGWRVSVHVPLGAVFSAPSSEEEERFKSCAEERARIWGADEVIFDDGEGTLVDGGVGAAVRVLESLREEGDVFDGVVDTIGGRDVREGACWLLKNQQQSQEGYEEEGEERKGKKKRPVRQFTTLVGDHPERPVPSAGDQLRAGLRALGRGENQPVPTTPTPNTPNTPTPNTPHTPPLSTIPSSAPSLSRNNSGLGRSNSLGLNLLGFTRNQSVRVGAASEPKINQAWINLGQDVDWEGEDVGETLGRVVGLAVGEGVRPWVWPLSIGGDGGEGGERSKVVMGLDKAPSVFSERGPLAHGGTVVVRVAQ